MMSQNSRLPELLIADFIWIGRFFVVPPPKTSHWFPNCEVLLKDITLDEKKKARRWNRIA